jgi:hypothetical protein
MRTNILLTLDRSEEMNEQTLLETIKKIKIKLDKKGYVFFSLNADLEDIQEIKNFYKNTTLDLSEKGIEYALMSNAISEPF